MNKIIQAVLLMLVVGLASALTGCGETPVPPIKVKISGAIIVPDGLPANGKVYVNLYHAWALEGILRHPIEEIESFEAVAGVYEHEFDYPPDRGEGLLIYAWIDSDADGALCAPPGGNRSDRAGLTEVQGFPASEVTANIELTVPCAAPNWFYPSAVSN